MIIIKKSQYSTFQDNLRFRFVMKMLPLVKSRFPEHVYGLEDAVVQDNIATITERAIHYKIEIEEDIYQFIMLDYRLGNKFEQLPEYKQVLKILQHPTLTGTRKIEKTHDIVFNMDNND